MASEARVEDAAVTTAIAGGDIRLVDRFRNLMVCLSRDERDAGLIEYACMLARLGKATDIRFVHVLPTPRKGLAITRHEIALKELETEVGKSRAAVPASIRLHFEAVRGPLVDGLLAFAAERKVDLILVGHGPGHPPGRGSLVRRLTMKAPCSVWIVPDDSPARIKRILVPIDFSDHSADAMTVATSMARLAEAEKLFALHVFFNDAVITYEEAEPILQGEEKEAFERFVAPIDCRYVDLEPVFEEGGNIAHTIHRVAQEKNVDLKVMSTRGRSRSAAILLGSVTEGVIIEARTPLLIVKHYGAKLGLLGTLLDRSFHPKGSPHFN